MCNKRGSVAACQLDTITWKDQGYAQVLWQRQDSRRIDVKEENGFDVSWVFGLGLEDDIHWREGLLIAMLAHHVCTMNSPLPMLVKVREREKFEIRETTPLPIRSHFAFADHRLAYEPPLRSLSRKVPV